MLNDAMTIPKYIPPEYVAARTVLLDCLELLAQHLDAFVLVGAQALYLQTPPLDSGLPAATTDSDLAINPALLSREPDIAVVLDRAGFALHSNPGRWFAPNGVPIDLMVPSAVSLLSGRRTAHLAGHNIATARHTSGLELALVDNAMTPVTSLDPGDARAISVQVARPPALLIAKLIKLEERIEGSRIDRVISKDASDILRMLRYNDANSIGSQLRSFADDGHGSGTIERAIDFVRTQLDPTTSALARLAVSDYQSFEPSAQVARSMTMLCGRVVRSFDQPQHR